MELLAFGDTGWGDELFYATLMTIAVAITAMFIGFFFALIFTPLKLSKNKFFKIILPQTLRLAIPNLSNVWQITLKDTSLISVTGLVEIMRQSYIAAGSTRDPLFFYSFAAVLYLLLTFVSMKLINRLEVKYSRGY